MGLHALPLLWHWKQIDAKSLIESRGQTYLNEAGLCVQREMIYSYSSLLTCGLTGRVGWVCMICLLCDIKEGIGRK